MDDEIDMLALRVARIGKEKSRAQKQQCYGDPAKHIRFDSEKRGNRGKDANSSPKARRAK